MNSENLAYLMELIPWFEMPLFVGESRHACHVSLPSAHLFARADVGLSELKFTVWTASRRRA